MLSWNFIWGGFFTGEMFGKFFLVYAPGIFGVIFVGVNFSPRKCPGEMSGEVTGVGVRLPTQDYKSLHVPATILATKVNTQSQTQTQTQTVTDRQLCSSTFIFLFESQQPLFPPRLWNKLPKELRQPVHDESLSLSSHRSLTGSSSSPSSSSTLSLCISPSQFHARRETYLFHK